MSHYLSQAQKEGAIRFYNNEIFYAASGIGFPLTPEEQVRAEIYAKILYHYRYPAERIAFEYPVKMGSSYKRVDILILDEFQKPFCIVECKKSSIGESTFEEAIEQAFSYDNHLYAPYIWITSGRREIFFKSEHSSQGRRRYELNDLPKFGFSKQLWYKIYETGQNIWGFFKDIYVEFFAPTLRKRWFARLLLFLVVFALCNWLASWANIAWLTPYAMEQKWLQKSWTFEHLFYISASIGTLVGIWILRHSIIPDNLLSASKEHEKAKQRNNWVLIATILVLVPVYFWLKLFFDYDTKYCYGCKPCATEWRCWWSFAHFRLYTRPERIWEYLTPSWVILGVQAISSLVVSEILKWYASIR